MEIIDKPVKFVKKAVLTKENMGNMTLGQLEVMMNKMKEKGIHCHFEGAGDGTISIVED